VIRLTLIGERPKVVADFFPYFRITGGVVWTTPELGPIARFDDEGWKHQGTRWAGMRFEGTCRLVFGLPRDPIGVSEQLQSLSISGRVLSANGIPFSVYEPTMETWRGAVSEIWWSAFRIESADLRKTESNPAPRAPVIRQLDPPEE
jgi:hypothetical protein